MGAAGGRKKTPDDPLWLISLVDGIPMGNFYAYIMTNHSRTLYTGVTNDLERRVFEHRTAKGGAFTSKYRINKLVYYETFPDALQAIAAEKKIKGWTRAKKVALIESLNPHWIDLAEQWFSRPDGGN